MIPLTALGPAQGVQQEDAIIFQAVVPLSFPSNRAKTCQNGAFTACAERHFVKVGGEGLAPDVLKHTHGVDPVVGVLGRVPIICVLEVDVRVRVVLLSPILGLEALKDFDDTIHFPDIFACRGSIWAFDKVTAVICTSYFVARKCARLPKPKPISRSFIPVHVTMDMFFSIYMYRSRYYSRTPYIILRPCDFQLDLP